jgi:hypothetical protein
MSAELKLLGGGINIITSRSFAPNRSIVHLGYPSLQDKISHRGKERPFLRHNQPREGACSERQQMSNRNAIAKPIFGIKPLALRLYESIEPMTHRKSSSSMLAAYIQFLSVECNGCSLASSVSCYSFFASGSGRMPSASSRRRASSRAQV